MTPIDTIHTPTSLFQCSNLCDKQRLILGLIISFGDKGLRMSNGGLGELLGINLRYAGDLINDLLAKNYIKITGRQSKYRKIYFQKNLEVKTILLPEKTGSTSRNIWNITKGTKGKKGKPSEPGLVNPQKTTQENLEPPGLSEKDTRDCLLKIGWSDSNIDKFVAEGNSL